ncbi:hypothetical protein [Micromonospora sp. CV4]|uniref:hypothetical protein n=1 Tax=Micromonospora sp. CV4 TaxID=2478711 RepID=UPI000EF4A7AA|nr:hypothetical protein [Micromonospora sp. CV4]RLP92767.1 hypothetical protein EAD98_20500 [Micromonospora sp. CV4]
MDAAPDDRLRSAALVGVALAALAVGGWWWRAAAPAVTAQPVPTPTARVDDGGPDGTPDVRRTVQLDTGSGEIVRAGESSAVRVDPETGMVVDIEGPPGEFFYQGDAAGGLPRFSETIWREQRELAPGQGVIRQSNDDGSRYLLQYRCTRPGTMAVTSTGAEIAGPPRIDCDGSITTAEVLPGGGPFRVSLSAVGDQPIDVEVQLVALPG